MMTFGNGYFLGKMRSAAVALVAATLLVGCSGDPRPLQEAVEASDIDLGSLVIDSGRTDDGIIAINPGQTLQFSFNAFDTENVELSVANSNRLWGVTNNDVAEISDSGRLLGLSDGVVDVGLRIGGIIAQPVRVLVSTAELASISSIEGEVTLTECSTSSAYTAQGLFTDSTIRGLDNVEWSMPENEIGRILSSDLSEAVVGVVRPGSVTLVATVGTVTGSQDISVEPGLDQLTIIPEEIEVERSADVSVRASTTYTTDTAGQGATRLVTWSVPEGDITANVSNDVDREGVLRGLRIGTTTLSASCGESTAVALVTVVEPANIVRLEIEPDDDPITINASGADFQLRAYAISSRGSREEITQNASWQVESGEEFVSIDNSSSSGGLLDPIAPGRATIEVGYINLTQQVTVVVQ